jgi:hypothetical protein
MKLLIQSAMIFFGTLMAAGLVALGEPAATRLALGAQTRLVHAPLDQLQAWRSIEADEAAREGR